MTVDKKKLGARVMFLKDLNLLALQRRSVICPNLRCWSRPRPAAFMIGLQGRYLLRLFESGMYVYLKEKKCHEKNYIPKKEAKKC